MKLQVGGDFYYYAEKSEQKPDLLLMAGGVGINPLISTMRHAEDLNEGSGGHSEHFDKLMLLYSARTKEELIFHVSVIHCVCCCKPHHADHVIGQLAIISPKKRELAAFL